MRMRLPEHPVNILYDILTLPPLKLSPAPLVSCITITCSWLKWIVLLTTLNSHPVFFTSNSLPIISAIGATPFPETREIVLEKRTTIPLFSRVREVPDLT